MEPTSTKDNDESSMNQNMLISCEVQESDGKHGSGPEHASENTSHMLQTHGLHNAVQLKDPTLKPQLQQRSAIRRTFSVDTADLARQGQKSVHWDPNLVIPSSKSWMYPGRNSALKRLRRKSDGSKFESKDCKLDRDSGKLDLKGYHPDRDSFRDVSSFVPQSNTKNYKSVKQIQLSPRGALNQRKEFKNSLAVRSKDEILLETSGKLHFPAEITNEIPTRKTSKDHICGEATFLDDDEEGATTEDTDKTRPEVSICNNKDDKKLLTVDNENADSLQSSIHLHNEKETSCQEHDVNSLVTRNISGTSKEQSDLSCKTHMENKVIDNKLLPSVDKQDGSLEKSETDYGVERLCKTPQNLSEELVNDQDIMNIPDIHRNKDIDPFVQEGAPCNTELHGIDRTVSTSLMMDQSDTLPPEEDSDYEVLDLGYITLCLPGTSQEQSYCSYATLFIDNDNQNEYVFQESNKKQKEEIVFIENTGTDYFSEPEAQTDKSTTHQSDGQSYKDMAHASDGQPYEGLAHQSDRQMNRGISHQLDEECDKGKTPQPDESCDKGIMDKPDRQSDAGVTHHLDEHSDEAIAQHSDYEESIKRQRERQPEEDRTAHLEEGITPQSYGQPDKGMTHQPDGQSYEDITPQSDGQSEEGIMHPADGPSDECVTPQPDRQSEEGIHQSDGDSDKGIMHQPDGQSDKGIRHLPDGQCDEGLPHQPNGQLDGGILYQPDGQSDGDITPQPDGQFKEGVTHQTDRQSEEDILDLPDGQSDGCIMHQPDGHSDQDMTYLPDGPSDDCVQYEPDIDVAPHPDGKCDKDISNKPERHNLDHNGTCRREDIQSQMHDLISFPETCDSPEYYLVSECECDSMPCEMHVDAETDNKVRSSLVGKGNTRESPTIKHLESNDLLPGFIYEDEETGPQPSTLVEMDRCSNQKESKATQTGNIDGDSLLSSVDQAFDREVANIQDCILTMVITEDDMLKLQGDDMEVPIINNIQEAITNDSLESSKDVPQDEQEKVSGARDIEDDEWCYVKSLDETLSYGRRNEMDVFLQKENERSSFSTETKDCSRDEYKVFEQISHSGPNDGNFHLCIGFDRKVISPDAQENKSIEKIVEQEMYDQHVMDVSERLFENQNNVFSEQQSEIPEDYKDEPVSMENEADRQLITFDSTDSSDIDTAKDNTTRGTEKELSTAGAVAEKQHFPNSVGNSEINITLEKQENELLLLEMVQDTIKDKDGALIGDEWVERLQFQSNDSNNYTCIDLDLTEALAIDRQLTSSLERNAHMISTNNICQALGTDFDKWLMGESIEDEDSIKALIKRRESETSENHETQDEVHEEVDPFFNEIETKEHSRSDLCLEREEFVVDEIDRRCVDFIITNEGSAATIDDILVQVENDLYDPNINEYIDISLEETSMKDNPALDEVSKNEPKFIETSLNEERENKDNFDQMHDTAISVTVPPDPPCYPLGDTSEDTCGFLFDKDIRVEHVWVQTVDRPYPGAIQEDTQDDNPLTLVGNSYPPEHKDGEIKHHETVNSGGSEPTALEVSIGRVSQASQTSEIEENSVITIERDVGYIGGAPEVKDIKETQSNLENTGYIAKDVSVKYENPNSMPLTPQGIYPAEETIPPLQETGDTITALTESPRHFPSLPSGLHLQEQPPEPILLAWRPSTLDASPSRQRRGRVRGVTRLWRRWFGGAQEQELPENHSQRYIVLGAVGGGPSGWGKRRGGMSLSQKVDVLKFEDSGRGSGGAANPPPKPLPGVLQWLVMVGAATLWMA